MTILLVSMLSTIFLNVLKKKKQPQPNSIMELPVFNVVGSNETMITMKRIISYSVSFLVFFCIWIIFSFFEGFMAFNFVLFFFLILNFIPPIYFIGCRDKLTVAISILKEMVM